MVNCQLSQSPLVSVIIPAYNAERFIGQTLNSVLAQTYKNLEVIVVDDGSTDLTAEIVKKFIEQDPRVTLLQQPNSGVAAARNLGIQHSKGEFIAPIDSDDIWYSLNIERQVQRMVQVGPKVGLVYSWSIDIDQDDNPTGVFRAAQIEGEVYTTLLLHDFIANASSVMFRRSCIQSVGSYNSNLKDDDGQGREDWDLYLRIAECYEFRVVPEFLVGYRKLPNSMSRDYRSMAKFHELIWQSIREKYPYMPALIYRLSTSSFYMNLARQSALQKDIKAASFWIREALRKDLVTPFFRTCFYTVFISYFLLEPLRLATSSDQIGVNKSSSGIQVCSVEPNHFTSNMLGNWSRRSNFKTVAEKLLHYVASSIFRKSNAWKRSIA